MTKRLSVIGLLALSFASAAFAVEPYHCQEKTYCFNLGFWITCEVWGDGYNACSSSAQWLRSVSCNGIDESGQWKNIRISCDSSQ